jgi:enoyl-CoA hydratase
MMALVELIRGYLTSDATHDAVKALAEKLGKSPITVKNAPGFVVNRILVPMINEAFFVLSEGIATAEDIDAGMKLGCNQPIGPLALADMIGLDVCLAVMEVYLEQFGDSKYRPCPLLKEMVAAGPAGPQDRPRRVRLLSLTTRTTRRQDQMTATPTTPPAEGCIDTQVLDHVLLIGINRPAKRNGWTPPMFKQLAEAYTRLDDDPNLRVGVLHAFGDHFTAGLDLPAVTEYMKRGEKAIPAGLVEPHDFGLPDYRRRTKPMVVAVKGICFTVGIELMLGADIVVAADNCRFSQMEVQRGIMATGGATLRMAERAGMGNAMLHLLTADEFDSAEAYRLHFVQKVVAGRAGTRCGAGHCAAHRGASAARGRGHAAQRDQGRGTRAARGGVGIHRDAEAPLQQRGRGRRRALLHRASSRAFQRSIGKARPQASRTSCRFSSPYRGRHLQPGKAGSAVPPD